MSDQDFFFDEDEQPKKDAPKASSTKKASGSSRAAAQEPAGGQSVSMTIMALVAVVALLLGMIIGIFVGRGLASTAVPAVGAGATTGGSSAPVAPQLTPEQLQGGELPPGHPDLSGGSGAATGSADATKSE